MASPSTAYILHLATYQVFLGKRMDEMPEYMEILAKF